MISLRSIIFNDPNYLLRRRWMFVKSRTIFSHTNLTSVQLKTNNYKDQKFHSTKCGTETVARKRNRRPRGSKYTELLQVTSTSAKQLKTKVKNLQAGNLSTFLQTNKVRENSNSNIEQHEKSNNQIKYQPFEYKITNLQMIDVSELQNEKNLYKEKPVIFVGEDMYDKEIFQSGKLKEILESIEQFKEPMDENFENFSSQHKFSEIPENLPPETDIIENESEPIKKVKVKDVALNKKTASKNKNERAKVSKHHLSAEHEKLAKEKSLSINLHSYVRICNSTGMINRALTTIMTYRNKYPNNKFIKIDTYNILLHGYAAKGQYSKIKDILNILKEDKIALNHQSFAAIFECLGRLENNDKNLEEIKKYKIEAEKLGITLNDIMDKSQFLYDQREIVLYAINQIEPNFIPTYTKPQLLYKNVLLEKLNSNEFEKNLSAEEKTYSSDFLRNLAREQLEIELEGSITVKSVEKEKLFNDTNDYEKKFNELCSLWKNQISEGINRDLTTIRARIRHKPYGFMTYFTYLKVLDVKQYTDILLKEIKVLASGSETYSPTVNQLYKDLGTKVKMRYLINQKQKNGVLNKIGDVYSDYCEELAKKNTNNSFNTRKIWQNIVHSKKETGASIDADEIFWPKNVSIYIGRFLYNILMRDIKIDVNIMKNNKKTKTQRLLPAFYTLYRNHSKVVKEEVKPHPVLVRLLQASRQHELTFSANMVPMLCPPQPWTSTQNGGYLLTKSELIRLPQQAQQQWKRIDETDLEQIYPALDSLNQLSNIPWRVNTEVLDIILKVFNDGGNDKLDVPQHPSTLPPLPTINENESELSKSQQQLIFQQKMLYKRKQAEMFSLWCDTLYRLSLANHYRNKVFWLPHNMDFRGRVYPIPPHLNHLGSDLARSMLIFDEARPLGKDGFTWLKLHCINLTGFKKRNSTYERILYAEEVMDDIIDSADNPLTGRKWWTKSDEPWQTLACCMEIAKIKRSNVPEEEYMSRFPIHQDGSCNGLQHYAALGRDKAGAESVNLTPSSIPQDVYSSVATLVEKCRQHDENNGIEVAKILNGFVQRKVIKQTVMTTVYGVTRYGARLQIAKQLKDIEEFPKEWVWPASSYLTTKTFECLREMFTSAKEIQDWFTECARVISSSCNQNVEWITPLGLPVVQPYSSKMDSVRFSKNSDAIKENMSFDMYEKPNTMKQKNAFPPNFIHSLDSSHMMLTSLYCERKGITFVSIHDCFWTHACTVPDMNKICREQFVSLHSQPILEELSKFLVKTYAADKQESNQIVNKTQIIKTLKVVPQKGDYDIHEVLNAVYFFS